MTIDDAIELLVAKFEAIAEVVDRSETRAHAQGSLKMLDELCRHPRLSMAQLRCFDREGPELTLKWEMTKEVQAEVRARLVARFKASRVGASDRSAIQRALKCGEIADLEEYYQLKDVVAMGPEEAGLNEENFSLIDSMVEAYDGPADDPPGSEPVSIKQGAKKSRRVPPPPFDFTLEADERICAADTPLETRARFVRAKTALLAAGIADSERRAMCFSSPDSRVDYALGPNVPLERRAEELEACELESESRAPYDIGGAHLRAVELELEKGFGFRRLGPSRQARVAAMLKSGDPGTRENRRFIEAFIYAYPHQTLFTKEEMKRAAVLLKPPPRPQPIWPKSMESPPATPAELATMCIGAVFQCEFWKIMESQPPVRVLGFDEQNVLFDVKISDADDWRIGERSSRGIFLKDRTSRFLKESVRLGTEELSPRLFAAVRPDLPIRFAQSARVEWREGGFETREVLADYLRQHDPELLAHPPIRAAQVKLIPSNTKGVPKRGIMVTSEGGIEVTIPELLWHAYQHHVAPTMSGAPGGIGFFRRGFEKGGVPTYCIGGHVE